MALNKPATRDGSSADMAATGRAARGRHMLGRKMGAETREKMRRAKLGARHFRAASIDLDQLHQLRNSGLLLREIAARTGRSIGLVSRALRGKTWHSR